MNLYLLTPDIINAIGYDAGNTSMRSENRTRWNQKDVEAAMKATTPLWETYLNMMGIEPPQETKGAPR